MCASCGCIHGIGVIQQKMRWAACMYENPCISITGRLLYNKVGLKQRLGRLRISEMFGRVVFFQNLFGSWLAQEHLAFVEETTLGSKRGNLRTYMLNMGLALRPQHCTTTAHIRSRYEARPQPEDS